MFLSGFTFIRNGNVFDFPYRESIQSLLPFCNEVVVAVGDCQDGTRDVIETLRKDLAPGKLRIVDTVWDLSQCSDGSVLASETNKALQHCRGDWCFYLQADEVLHESERGLIWDALRRADANPRVDAIAFTYLHFYGNFDFVNRHPSCYRQEIRLFRNYRGITSFRDAQGFRGPRNTKLNAILSKAHIYHYGYSRPPAVLKSKMAFSDSLYGHDQMRQTPYQTESIPWVYGLTRFRGTHPHVMHDRIQKQKWELRFTKQKIGAREVLKRFNARLRRACEILFGFIPGQYKSFRLIRE